MNLGNPRCPQKACQMLFKSSLYPYLEPNGSLLGFLNGTKTHCIRYAQHTHMVNISSNGYMRGIHPNHTDLNCYVYASHASDVNTCKKHYWLHTFHDLKRSNI